MADDDFEIDIYGTGENDHQHDAPSQETNTQAYDNNAAITVANGSNNSMSSRQDDYESQNANGHEMETSHDETGRARSVSQPPQQGVKRKEGSDDRPIDPGATNCLMISDLSWWNTDDDIRKWIVEAHCEDELKDITFSEHKVNGKSKGQAYVDFTSQQAATATKHVIDTTNSVSGGKKPTAVYSTPHNNPFRTLPKDAPARSGKDQTARGGANTGGYTRGSFNSNYRGRGNFNGPRGGFNPNFGGGNMGFNSNNNMGGFNPSMGGGFNSGYNNRGGMMRGGPGGIRGGRGGMNNMMGNMGNMGMMGGGMPGNMGMGMMGGGMPGFNGMQPPFNPGFFGGNQGGGNDWQQNPHGAKRPRGE